MHKNMLYKVEKLSLRLIYSRIDKGGKVIYRDLGSSKANYYSNVKSV